MSIQTLLTVCVGNICRSPMAQAVLAEALPEHDVVSAGLQPLYGHPADPIACELMRIRGLDIERHRARELNAELCRRADLILVMDADQRALIERRFPFARGKVFRLGEFGAGDVPDPYRAGRQAFEQALVRIDQGAGQWVNRISRTVSR